MIHKRQAAFSVTHILQATRRNTPGWLVWFGRMLRRVDVRKPVHAAAVGVILAGVLAPVIGELVLREQYRLSQAERNVIERPSPRLMDKLVYDDDKRAHVFNANGEVPEDPSRGGALAAETGGGKNQLYTATMPDDPALGITVRDNVNKVTVNFKPQLALLGGRGKDGHVVYPLKDMAGHMVFTPKGNGLKEDIYLEHAPKGDTAIFDYEMVMPDYVEARLDEDGSVGFYTADQQFFGNISYGSAKDEELIAKARQNNVKKYEMFKIPAPVVRQTGKGGEVLARFQLDGKKLSVFVKGLARGGYPLSVDPTFLLASTSDFALGSIDDNIDLTQANQIGRFPLSGGSVSGWTSDASGLVTGNYDGAMIAYNNAMYIIGGGNQDGTTANLSTSQVRYVLLNANGTENGSWTTTSALNMQRQGLVGFGFNGYLYAVGGEDSNNSGNVITTCTTGTYTGQNCTVEYAKINSDGSVGAWAPTSALSTAVSYPAGAAYQGVLYVIGGATGAGGVASLVTTSQYARINADGTVGTWSTTTGLATATARGTGGAYNGYVYVVGGYTLPGGVGTVVNTVAYAPIKSDGTLGTWSTTTSFPSARRGHGFAVINGHMYVYAGCSSASLPCPNGNYQSDTLYAVINADGTVGQWQRTQDYVTSNPRVGPMSAYYNGFLHFVGGCSNDVGTSNIKCTGPGLSNSTATFYTGFDVTGRFDRGVQTIQTTRPYNNNAATLTRMGAQAVALNGYVYLIGGCNVSNCGTATSYTATVEYAQIAADGTLGTFATTNSIISTSGGANNAGRIGHMVLAYNNKVYVIGGIEKTTGNANSFRSDVISATQNTNGTLGTFAAETNSLPAAKAFGTAAVWHNWFYVIGGLSAATTVVGTIYKSQISSNAPGTWAATTQGLTNARWGHSGGIWGNWLYVVGGQSDTAGTYITAANGTEQLTIANSGDITASPSVQNVSGAPLTRLMGGFVQNGVLYTFGGYTNGSTSAVATMNWSKLDASTGALAAWSATNIGNAPPSTAGLATARGATTAVTVNGMFYVMAGCTSALAANSFSACSAFVSTTNTTEAYLTNNGGTGQPNAFAAATVLPTVNSVAGRADHASVAYNGYLYILGGCFSYTSGACSTNSNQTSVQAAPINAEGTLGSWTATGMTALPEESSLGGAAAYNGYIYVVQGKSNGANANVKVWYAQISSTGTIGSWTDSSSNYLPSGTDRNSFGIAIARGYLYIAGGDNGSGTKKSDVYYTKINSQNGTLSQPVGGCTGGNVWCSTTAFTTARSGLNLMSYNGALYVMGGTDGTNNLTDIQFAATSSTDGSISSWNYTTDVARGLTSRQVVGANGYLYFLGNEGSETGVRYMDVNANGTLGLPQFSANALAGGHAHGAAAYYNGFVYVTGGCTLSGGTCSSVLTSGTSEYAGLAGISRTGHYSKLFTTQIDTAPSQLSINGGLSGPGSVVTARFQTATAATPTFGVAQLISPMLIGNFYNVKALDPSGNDVGLALNYLLIFALDDSNSGTFPDTTTTTETNISSVTLYYHANPSRRLRHGASFTSTDCNAVPANGCILDTAP